MENIHDKDIKDWEYLTSNVFNDNEKIELAIDIFRKRIENRYFKAIDILLNGDNSSAFAIISLDCLLIETLQSFYDWLLESKGQSEILYKEFLTKSLFKSVFNDELAIKFYKNFRCWLLHQWEIFEKSLISNDQNKVIKLSTNWITVNYIKFHKLLLIEFKAYIGLLKDDSQITLRNNFMKKMNSIYS